jgi:hypothetical protein
MVMPKLVENLSLANQLELFSDHFCWLALPARGYQDGAKQPNKYIPINE